MDTRRDFIYISDLIDVVIWPWTARGSSGPYHVSSGSDFAIKELFDATVKALGMTLGHEVEVRPRSEDDAFTILLDPSETIRDFGWKTITPLEAGVKSAIDYYKNYGITETFTHLKVPDKA